MIDWSKPIETVDGRRAKVLSGVMLASDHTRTRAVYITPPAGGIFGDVVLVNDNGFRCDDNALLKTEQIIRNARVKREGWVLVRPHGEEMERRYLANDNVYASEAEAELSKKRWYGADPGIKTVHLTWEEYPCHTPRP